MLEVMRLEGIKAVDRRVRRINNEKKNDLTTKKFAILLYIYLYLFIFIRVHIILCILYSTLANTVAYKLIFKYYT